MISLTAAQELSRAGVRWVPRTGDQFTVRSDEMGGEVFTVADMVVEAREYPTGMLLAFNGTTEWALDSAQVTDALWLPREDQLRELLGTPFRALDRRDDGYRVTAVLPGDDVGTVFDAPAPADAYGRALLALIRRATD